MRYQNPHMQSRPQQQWGGQQPQQLTPQQMAALQQQQMLMQQQMMQQQGQFQPQQQFMNPQMQQQFMQQQQFMNQPQGQYVPQQQFQQQQFQPQQNRFGNSNQQATVPQGTFQGGQQQQFDHSEKSDRFGSKQEPQMQTQPVQQPVALTGPEDLVVDTKPHSFPRNDKVQIKVRVMTVSDKNLTIVKDTLMAYNITAPTDDLLENEAHSKKGLTDVNFICRPMVLMEEHITSNMDTSDLFSGDSVQTYKVLSKLFKESEVVEDLLWLERVNNYLTEKLNKLLEIDFYNYGISIDSFVEDYGSLMKAIRSMDDEEFTYEGVIEGSMNDLVKEMNQVQGLVSGLHEGEEKPFGSQVSTVIMEDTSHVLGLGKLEGIRKLVANNPNNNTLITLTATVCEFMGVNEYLLYTTDGEIYRFLVNSKGEVFVEKA